MRWQWTGDFGEDWCQKLEVTLDCRAEGKEKFVTFYKRLTIKVENRDNGMTGQVWQGTG